MQDLFPPRGIPPTINLFEVYIMNLIFSILVKNEPGVLIRIASLFSRRNFNIHSLAVGTTHDSNISRITIILNADLNRADQIISQIQKSPVVLAVQRLDPSNTVAREIALIKVHSTLNNRDSILNIANAFRANVVDLSPNSIILEFTGSANKINAAAQALSTFGIIELIQSGLIALNRQDPIPYASKPTFLHKNLL